MASANRTIPVPSFNRQQKAPINIPQVQRTQRDVAGLFRKPNVPTDLKGGAPTPEELAQQEVDAQVEMFCNMLTFISFTVPFFEIIDGSKEPEYAHEGDACVDLYARLDKDVEIFPNQRVLISTGYGVMLPPSFELQIRSRSGNAAKKGLMVLNSPGTIDSNYRGMIGVILYNSDEHNRYVITNHDPIAQGKVSWAPKVKVITIPKEDVDKTNRGEQGFGSTGLAGGKA